MFQGHDDDDDDDDDDDTWYISYNVQNQPKNI